MINNYQADGSKRICTVTAVDLRRKVCKCISDLGELLLDVRWLVSTGGSDGTNSSTDPVEGSRVLVDISTGFPFILGAIFTDSADTLRRPNIGMQDIDEKVIADYSTIPSGDLIRGPGTPKDQRVGDLINTTDGGGMQGTLHGGTVISKASPLAQIMLSRYGDLVRVVSRNYEHFSDVDNELKASIRGSLYAKKEIYRDPVNSRNETPSYIEYSGNVQAGELIEEKAAEGYTDEEGIFHKFTYATLPASEFPEIPADDGVIKKTYTINDEYVSKIYSDNVDGTSETSITNSDGSSTHYLKNDSTSYLRTFSDANGVTATASQDAISFNHTVTSSEGEIIVKGDSSGVLIDAGGKTTILVGADGKLTVTTTGDTLFDVGGALDIKTGGNTTFESGGNFTVTAPIIQLN